jgi:hypothetical protein
MKTHAGRWGRAGAGGGGGFDKFICSYRLILNLSSALG